MQLLIVRQGVAYVSIRVCLRFHPVKCVSSALYQLYSGNYVHLNAQSNWILTTQGRHATCSVLETMRGVN